MEQEESEAAPEKDAETTDETLVGTDNSMEDVTGDDRAVNSKEEPARAEQVNQDSDDSSHSKGGEYWKTLTIFVPSKCGDFYVPKGTLGGI